MRANKTKAGNLHTGTTEETRKVFGAWTVNTRIVVVAPSFFVCYCCGCAVLARDPLRRQVANVNCVHKLQHNCKFA